MNKDDERSLLDIEMDSVPARLGGYAPDEEIEATFEDVFECWYRQIIIVPQGTILEDVRRLTAEHMRTYNMKATPEDVRVVGEFEGVMSHRDGKVEFVVEIKWKDR